MTVTLIIIAGRLIALDIHVACEERNLLLLVNHRGTYSTQETQASSVAIVHVVIDCCVNLRLSSCCDQSYHGHEVIHDPCVR